MPKIEDFIDRLSGGQLTNKRIKEIRMSRKYEITIVTGETYTLITKEDRRHEDIINEFLDDLGLPKEIVTRATVEIDI